MSLPVNPSHGSRVVDASPSIVRKGCLLKLGGKNFHRKLQWRICMLTSDGMFSYYEVKGESNLLLKGTIKLDGCECRLEASGGELYDTIRKLKPPKPPSGTAMWANSGYFYIKPKPAPNEKHKTYYFVCDIRERDKWIYSIREVTASLQPSSNSNTQPHQTPQQQLNTDVPSSPSTTSGIDAGVGDKSPRSETNLSPNPVDQSITTASPQQPTGSILKTDLVGSPFEQLDNCGNTSASLDSVSTEQGS